MAIRMGFARLAESSIRSIKGKGESEKLTAPEKILSSSIGGALATWNQPIEVIRVEVSNLFYKYYLNVAHASDFLRCNQWLRMLLPIPIDLLN